MLPVVKVTGKAKTARIWSESLIRTVFTDDELWFGGLVCWWVGGLVCWWVGGLVCW